MKNIGRVAMKLPETGDDFKYIFNESLPVSFNFGGDVIGGAENIQRTGDLLRFDLHLCVEFIGLYESGLAEVSPGISWKYDTNVSIGTIHQLGVHQIPDVDVKQPDYQNPYRNIEVEMETHPIIGVVPNVKYPVDNESEILDATAVKSTDPLGLGLTEEEEAELKRIQIDSYWRDSWEDYVTKCAASPLTTPHEFFGQMAVNEPTWHGFDLGSPEGDQSTYLLKEGENVISGKKLHFHTIKCPQKEAARKQLKIDTVRLTQAEAESINSNCQKHMVGCIITDVDGRILSSGYNGTPAGHENCSDRFPDYDKVFGGDCDVTEEHMEKMVLEHREWSMHHEIHAEVNALLNSDPVKRRGGTLYVNLQPCENCAKMIAASGVSRVVYGIAYHRANNAVSEAIFRDSRIEYIHLDKIIRL